MPKLIGSLFRVMGNTNDDTGSATLEVQRAHDTMPPERDSHPDDLEADPLLHAPAWARALLRGQHTIASAVDRRHTEQMAALRNLADAVSTLSARLGSLESSHRRSERRIGDLEERADNHDGRITELERLAKVG